MMAFLLLSVLVCQVKITNSRTLCSPHYNDRWFSVAWKNIPAVLE